MIYLQEDGLRQVIQGKTAIEELLRVVRIRPPTPVPVIDSSGTECSDASLRTSGVT